MKNETVATSDAIDTRQLLRFLSAWKKGDFSGRLPLERRNRR